MRFASLVAVAFSSLTPSSQERTAKAMVSVIRNKQRKKEVENLKARTVVQTDRQRRHRKAGLGGGANWSEEEQLNAVLKSKRSK